MSRMQTFKPNTRHACQGHTNTALEVQRRTLQSMQTYHNKCQPRQTVGLMYLSHILKKAVHILALFISSPTEHKHETHQRQTTSNSLSKTPYPTLP